MRPIEEIVKEWHDTIYSDNPEAFLDFAEGLNINEFTIEDGVRTIWLEDGMSYTAHGQAIKETDSSDAKDIIIELQDLGIEFEEEEEHDENKKV